MRAAVFSLDAIAAEIAMAADQCRRNRAKALSGFTTSELSEKRTTPADVIKKTANSTKPTDAPNIAANRGLLTGQG